MTENRTETGMSAGHDEVTKVARQEWQRPEWRKLSADEAETTSGGNNNDVVFS